MRPLPFAVLLFVALLMPRIGAGAEVIDNAAALKDLKQGRGVFLVDIGAPPKLATYLEIIEGTYDNLVRENVRPDFVLVFIGPSVQFLTSEPAEEIVFEYSEDLKRIAESTVRLHKLGVRQEVCAVATQVFGIDNATLLSGLTLVGDGFVSLIGWQAQGYHLVPVF
jgi:intracellular sulfur oxidation DsrE/DsrF family protein